MEKYFDEYVIKARILPAALVVSPLVVFLPLIAPEIYGTLKVFAGTTLVGVGGITLATIVVREFGVRYEREYLKMVGGWPSTIIMRWRDNRRAKGFKERYHRAVSLKLDINLLSEDQERQEPERADQEISGAFEILKNKIRGNESKNSHKDNIAYGFARNLFGSRWLWTASAGAAFLCCTLYPYFARGEWMPTLIVLSGLVMLGVPVVEFGIIKSHVEHCSFRYAESAWSELDNLPDREAHNA